MNENRIIARAVVRCMKIIIRVKSVARFPYFAVLNISSATVLELLSVVCLDALYFLC